MNRAAVIIEGKGFDRNLSMLFGKPWQLGRVLFNINDKEYEIIILEVPYINNPKSQNKRKQIVEKYCKNIDIHTLIYKKTKDADIDERLIAIKIICTLRKVENTNKIGIFKKRFGIIFNNLNPLFIEALSIEASSIIILNREFERDKTEKLYEKIIRDTGLSIVYTKDLTVLIEKSDAILCENTGVSKNYKGLLFDKIILFNDWNKTILLPRPINYVGADSLEVSYNDEIIEAFLSFNNGISVWNAAKCFTIYTLYECG